MFSRPKTAMHVPVTVAHRIRTMQRGSLLKPTSGSPQAYPGETFHHFKARRDTIRRTISFEDSVHDRAVTV